MTPRALLFDCHVHLYKEFDLERALLTCHENLAALASKHKLLEPVKGIVIVERSDCFYFKALVESRLSLPAGFSTRSTEEPNSLWIISKSHPDLCLIAARQTNTLERVEVLALGVAQPFPDGRPLQETLAHYLAENATCVLNWAPGKWMFKRYQIVKNAISDLASPLVLGDSALRPQGWLEPELMKLGTSLGRTIIAGSDPLPLANEELRIGSYASCLEASFDTTRPFKAFSEALNEPSRAAVRIGRRLSVLELIRILKANQKVRSDWSPSLVQP